eukprot:m.182757 g.182757  ORF g.182757 m.182757 type:complete len:543 (+) comp15621_c0_seq1:118-1746(+)
MGAFVKFLDAVWAGLEKNDEGLVTGSGLYGTMKASGLSEDILRSIWSSCDPDGVGALTYQRVGFVFGLISQAQRGCPPDVAAIGPDTPPPTLASVPGLPKSPPSVAPRGSRTKPVVAPKKNGSTRTNGSSGATSEGPADSSDSTGTGNPFGPAEHAAATAIQSMFRGYTVRKSLLSAGDTDVTTGTDAATQGGGTNDGEEGDVDADAVGATVAGPTKTGGPTRQRQQSGRLRQTKERALKLSEQLDNLVSEAVPEESESDDDVDAEGDADVDLDDEGHADASKGGTQDNVPAENDDAYVDIIDDDAADTNNSKQADKGEKVAAAQTHAVTASASPPKPQPRTASQQESRTSTHEEAPPGGHIDGGAASEPAVAEASTSEPPPAQVGAEDVGTTPKSGTGEAGAAVNSHDKSDSVEEAAPKENNAVETDMHEAVVRRPQSQATRERRQSTESRISISIPGGLPPPPTTQPPAEREETMAGTVQGLQAQLRLAWQQLDKVQAESNQREMRVEALKKQLKSADVEHKREMRQLREQAKKGKCIIS